MLQDQLLVLGVLSLFTVIGGLAAARFKQPYVLGLIIFGALIGPNLLNLVHDPDVIELLIEFGTILFLFSIGLEFSLKKLLAMGSKTVTVTLYKVGAMSFIGFACILLLGHDTTTALFVGIALSFSSTMIILNILKQKGLAKRQEMPLLMGVLILEDIFGIVALTFLAATKEQGNLLVGVENLLISVILLLAVYVLASAFAERLVKWVIRHAGEESIIFISLSLCAGFALFAYLLKLSPGAGAFLAGSVVSTFRQSKAFEHTIKPYSFLFTSFFFLGIGTMVNVKTIIHSIPTILYLLAITAVALPLAMGLSAKLIAGFTDDQAIFSSIAMLPPGIFSLLIAKESIKYGVTLDLVTIISTMILVQSILMSFGVTRTHLLRYPRALSARLSALAQNIRTIRERLSIETTQTHKYREANGELLILLVLILLPFLLLLKAAHHWESLALMIIAAIYGLAGAVYTAQKHREKERLLKQAIIHATSPKVARSYRLAKQATILLLLGLYSPMLIYALRLGPIVILPVAALLLFGLFRLFRANDSLLTRKIIRRPDGIRA